MLYDLLIDIMAHKQVTESTHVKMEIVQNKVKFVPLPDDIVEEAYEEEIDGEVIKQDRNTEHNALLYIKVGQYEVEEEIPIEVTSKDDKPVEMDAGMDMEGMDGEGDTQIISKWVDEDQQGKALSIQGTDIPNLQKQVIWSIS